MYKKNKQYRLYNYDYSQNGYYFITIVTKDREHFFGKIANQEITLTVIGEYVKSNILKFYVDEDLDNPYQNNPSYINANTTITSITEWSVLPDHIHLIVEIINLENKAYSSITGLSPLVKGSVSSFINHFKGHVKKWCNENNFPAFNWQSRFHDRVIRNEVEYENIALYIRNNVLNWR
ncbi:transposase [Ferruginibacter sp. SUN106]|uniref:transposase n=1 Tax=Ferruginibacter sp. SUN106 TaxID=2978348 RepID=UPI003D364876